MLLYDFARVNNVHARTPAFKRTYVYEITTEKYAYFCTAYHVLKRYKKKKNTVYAVILMCFASNTRCHFYIIYNLAFRCSMRRAIYFNTHIVKEAANYTPFKLDSESVQALKFVSLRVKYLFVYSLTA